MIFNEPNIIEVIDNFKKNLDYSFASVTHSTLGGADNVSLLIALSTDKKESWSGGFFENSTYVRIQILNDGTVEQFSGYKLKLRKKKVKSVDDAINYINSKMKIAIVPDNYNYFTDKLEYKYLNDVRD